MRGMRPTKLMQLLSLPTLTCCLALFSCVHSQVLQIKGGQTHTCARLFDATVKCWGGGNFGQLGYGDTANRGDGPGEMGDNLPRVDLGTGRTALQIATGGFHTCAVLDDGNVKCWGFNAQGQLGYGDTNARGDVAGELGDNLPAVDLGTGRTAVQIAAQSHHTCALLDDATLKCWGFASNGRLGYGDSNNRGDGPGEMGDNLPTVDLGTGRTAVQIVATNLHTCALLDDASVKCWGSGANGQLGYGDPLDRGREPGEMGDNLPTVDLGTGRSAVQIAAVGSRTCAVLDNGSVKCWGSGSFGQLGYGDTINRGSGPGEMGDNLTNVDLGTARTAVQIVTGILHTCVLLDDNSVKCWGVGGFGSLGYGDTNNRGDEPGEMGDDLPSVDLGTLLMVSELTAGNDHTCAVFGDSTFKCWGIGGSGQLGYGDVLFRGDGPGEMGDNLPLVNLGSDITRFPTASPSPAPSESPTRTPTLTPTGTPSLRPTQSPRVIEPDPLVDPAVIGGISAGAIVILGAVGFYFARFSEAFSLFTVTATKQEVALKA